MTTPDVTAQIQTPTGWVQLEDEANGYELHRDMDAARAVTFRRQEVSSPWMEGTYTNEAVRENISEAVVIWVTAATPFELDAKVTAVTDAFGQMSYQMVFTTGNLQETWTCFPADYTIETQAEYRFARTAVIRATVPRLPTVAKAEVV